MGILNVTPDSFADGGKHFNYESAIIRAKEMISEGVDIIDVGGESTRPGAERVTEEIERDRVIPVISELVELGVTVSVDTMRASTAEAAIGMGATYVNDVSGGLADPEMGKLLSRNPNIQYILMHWRGHSKNMNDAASYEDVVSEVKEELDNRVINMLKSGMKEEQIILDPGIGFGKSIYHSWEIIHRINEIKERFNLPILFGHSKKSFMKNITNNSKIYETLGISLSVAKSIDYLRVHDVKMHCEALSSFCY